MKKFLLIVAMAAVSFSPAFAVYQQGSYYGEVHRVGGGLDYFMLVDELHGAYADKGTMPFVSYQYVFSEIFQFQGDLRLFEDGFAGNGDVSVAPEVLLKLGSTFYTAGGLGILTAGGDIADSPYFIGRIGYDLVLANGWIADFHVDYRTASWEGINEEPDEEESDLIGFGAAIRLPL